MKLTEVYTLYIPPTCLVAHCALESTAIETSLLLVSFFRYEDSISHPYETHRLSQSSTHLSSV